MTQSNDLPSADRREFLRTGVTAGALVVGGFWPFPSAWAEPAPPGVLHAGPMQGYVASRSGIVWLQTPGAADVFVEFAPVDKPDDKRRTDPQKTVAEQAFCAHISIDDLTPGVNYHCQPYVNNQPVADKTLLLRTQKIWMWRGPAPDFTVLTGSCAYINDPFYERPGKPYGGGYEIYEPMAREQADLMVWLGDNLYFREPDLLSPEGMSLRYRKDRAFAPLQKFLRSTPQVAIWDDHDYGPNDSEMSFQFKGHALELFKTYWANPSYGLPGSPGVFTKVSQYDADFFLLDDRWYRDADRTSPGDRGKVMFGPEQMNWLRNALLFSKAKFKIIAAGGQFFNDDDAYEGWNQYPIERAEFLGWLQQYQIPGVLFLSGDRHITELIRYPRPHYGGKRDYPLIEFTSSPINSGPAEGDDDPNRVPGTLVTERNYGVLKFTGKGKDRTLELATKDTKGQTKWTHRITLADLGWD
ncbi:phosphodiesterase [Halothiobacillus diazotrophicus]|uniref:Phosphodiesterase n=1 Tax=Halothiobacillus diazotrophicus TaxID=1860122 RepID=A0A191ZE40_9GAMM|nr:alkaline phosphatase D family protein [Halothiobacillus diazotrophicus]ANJ66134.1 phosphodiesterase [Halothiobacillus diazotrophicus]